MQDTELASLYSLVEANERTVASFYRFITILLVLFLIAHLAFSSYYVVVRVGMNNSDAIAFAVFNLAALIVEIYLSRIAFMLGSRAGQLRDIRYCMLLSESKADLSRFHSAAQAVMSMRRDEAALKILDLEAVASGVVAKLPGTKSGSKDAA